jgi:zinc/manganese transport system substrate-binding protein
LPSATEVRLRADEDVVRQDRLDLDPQKNVRVGGPSGCGRTTPPQLIAGREGARVGRIPRKAIRGGLLGLALACASAHGEPVRIVAAESVYGDIARQIGGEDVRVTSILAGPIQDPHAFEPSAATARAVADARLLIYNGAGYDSWVTRLIAASSSQSRDVVEVARLAGRRAGANPHFWYDTRAISALATALNARLTQIDPVHRAAYAARLRDFEASLAALRERIATLHSRYAGTRVTATEPVFDYMADALGLEMRNPRFQLAIMNGTEPSAAAIAAFERDLRTRAVKILFYNTQTGQALAERMRALAERAGVPVVPITETKPEGQSYQAWMLSQLDALERALGETKAQKGAP